MSVALHPAMREDHDPLKNKSYQHTRLGPDIVDFLAWMKLGGTMPRTLDQYERDLARGALLYPNKDCTEITEGDMFQIAMLYKDAERRVRLAPWRKFFWWLWKKRKKIKEVPTDGLPEIKQRPQKVIRVFTDVEVAALLNLPVVDAAPLAVLLEAGLRKAEARDLRLQDCLPESGQLIVVQGKGAKDRIIPMTGRLKYLLNELALSERLNPSDHVFYGTIANASSRRIRRDHPIGEGTFARWWRRCLVQAAVPYRNPHTARHSFATRWRRLGLAMDEIQILLGHANLNTTASLYVHTGVADVAEHMALIEARR